MRTNKHLPHYTDFKDVVSNTTPGLSFSIGDLLARTVRGERLPGFASKAEIDSSPIVDWLNPEVGRREMKKVSDEMAKDSRNPLFQGDMDIIDAHSYLHKDEE